MIFSHFWLLYFKVHLWCKTFQSFYKHVHVHILIQIFMRKRSNKWNPKSAATLGLCRTIVSCNAGSTSCFSLTIFSRRPMLLSLNLTIILLLCKHLSFLLQMSWSCSIFSCKIWKYTVVIFSTLDETLVGTNCSVYWCTLYWCMDSTWNSCNLLHWAVAMPLGKFQIGKTSVWPTVLFAGILHVIQNSSLYKQYIV